MTKPWDETMKKLIDASPQQFLDWIAKGATFLHFEPTEVFKPKEEEEPLRADRYLAVELNGQQGIVHVEIQSGPDARMDERLLAYNFGFTQNDPLHRTVHSCVIYLRPVSNPPQPPLVRIFITGREIMRFDYDSIELAEMEAEELLNLGLPGILPLLPLTKGGSEHERVLTMFDRLQQTTRTDLIVVGATFASLAYGQDNRAEQDWLRKVIQDMQDIIQQTPLYQFWTREALEEGLKAGKAEGLLEGKLAGMRQTLVSIVRARFPRLAGLARTQAAQINDPDVLDDLIIQISTASKAQEVRRALLGEDENDKDS